MNESYRLTSGTAGPLCAFEMYFFHPIDEPDVAVDVSGLFDASSSSNSSSPKAPPSALSSSDDSEDSEGSTLCRPVPTMSLPDTKEAALSVVSSDEEDDNDDEDNEDDDDAASEFEDRENRPNAGRWGSALSTTTTNKRPVSQLDDSNSQGDGETTTASRRKQQRRCSGEEAPSSREASDSGECRPHDDAQQRARVLLWKQSLKRSLFYPFVEQA